MPRNRQQTESRIRDAARRILRERGFEAWGVNGIAREAGVDKVLIYRYFNSIEGLLEAVVAETPFWPDPDSLPENHAEAFLEATIDSFKAWPEVHSLLGHPSARRPLSPIRQKADADLQRWLDGLRNRTTGSIPSTDLEHLAAQLFFEAIMERDSLSTRELWQTVSPPLEWASGTHWSPNEELPTELL